MELLSPVGNFECLKAAVQNGADSVYFGAENFSARAFAQNFNLEELKQAIEYAKLRGVKTHLTLNTLLKDFELDSALNIAKSAYEFGIDAIIVQDLGLAKKLITLFPDLPIHASTQMTIHNLDGALELQKLGFKRIVLSRELSLQEIEHICKNTDIEVECFGHGALCISYSGQCLFSSMIGSRSGNRGKCAGPCRLPYHLLENNTKINSGYLLNTRDLCSLDYIPSLIKSGVTSIKIEGRMKSPIYVAIVTKIYRKYIDLAMTDKPYIVSEQDRKDLMQAFNRGMASSGHLEDEANNKLVYKEKPNNMGLYLGIVQNYNKNKGLITLKLNETIQIGDTISLQNESSSYTISELMENNKNITQTHIGQTVTIGRMKGNINLKDKIYKLSSKNLFTSSEETYKKENKKIPLNCLISIKKEQPISIKVTSANNNSIYKDLNITTKIDTIPVEAKNKPLTAEIIIGQITKTASTPYQFQNIKIDLDDNLFLPKISSLNELRRLALEQVQDFAINNIHRTFNNNFNLIDDTENTQLSNMRDFRKNTFSHSPIKISVLLNILNLNFDYSELKHIDNIYIPLKYFTNKKYSKILKTLSKKFDMFIYMPTIVKANYKNLFYANCEHAVKEYEIKGFVISNIGNIKLLYELYDDLDKHFKIISNYTFNIFNTASILEIKKLGISQYTISPELDKETIDNLCNYNYLQKELIVYGKTPVLNMNYCLLGESNKCYPNCPMKCINESNKYYLQDRLNMKFKVIADNIQTVTTVYNSKTTSISSKDFDINFARIDILDETISEINSVIETVKSGNRLEGKEYTNGNLNRTI